jgi:hypothetical protein
LPARFDRGFHGLRIGMHGQECGAKRLEAFDTTRNRIADVMQLQVHEDLFAGIAQSANQRKSAGKAELITDLVKRHALAETRDHRFRLFDIGQIERHNQSVDGGRLHVASHHALRNVDQLPHEGAERLDIGWMFQSVHIVVSRAGE